jgi:hypothetical protein
VRLLDNRSREEMLATVARSVAAASAA